MINHMNNSTIWYCTVKDSKIKEVQQKGLRCFSDPVFRDINYRVPWIIVETISKNTGSTFEVDLQDVEEKDTVWAFLDKNDPRSKVRLRVFKDILPDRVKLIS